MGTRTVRLDPEAEEALEEIRRTSGLSISDALKRGLETLRGEIRASGDNHAWDAYSSLNLGPGGYALVPSDASPAAVRATIAKKLGR